MPAPASIDRAERIHKAAVLYSIHGSSNIVANLTGTPERTIRDWMKSGEFQATLAECHKETSTKLQAKMKNIIADAYDRLHERVNNGDVKAIKTESGVELVNVPVTAKDLAIVAGVTIDKAMLISGQHPQQQQIDKLGDIAAQLERVAMLSASVQGQAVPVDNSVDNSA